MGKIPMRGQHGVVLMLQEPPLTYLVRVLARDGLSLLHPLVKKEHISLGGGGSLWRGNEAYARPALGKRTRATINRTGHPRSKGFDSVSSKGSTSREVVRYGLAFVSAFLVLFTFFALILWGASRNQKPVVSVNSVTFHSFVIQAGTDASLVPTEMSTINATVRLTFRNTGSFFGVHVTAQPVTLYYSQLLMASGDMKYFYQPRKSQRKVAVTVVGNKVPLYGGGAGLSSTPGPKGVPPPPVPLQLTLRIRARALVLGKLVKPRFYNNVQCSVRLDTTKLGKAISLKKSCTHV
ncbi:hypothetical protein TRIUR3_30260 [Triticum urartu]|uniref:Uncharacterized protein n=1 Tax=Triticum urartu TaxID=4572 RepID=M8A1G0_TRIUA|nr:hypothetical protein TRIUR3_30260 [Triticum urartu]